MLDRLHAECKEVLVVIGCCESLLKPSLGHLGPCHMTVVGCCLTGSLKCNTHPCCRQQPQSAQGKHQAVQAAFVMRYIHEVQNMCPVCSNDAQTHSQQPSHRMCVMSNMSTHQLQAEPAAAFLLLVSQPASRPLTAWLQACSPGLTTCRASTGLPRVAPPPPCRPSSGCRSSTSCISAKQQASPSRLHLLVGGGGGDGDSVFVSRVCVAVLPGSRPSLYA